jgi:hypothetical protein
MSNLHEESRLHDLMANAADQAGGASPKLLDVETYRRLASRRRTRRLLVVGTGLAVVVVLAVPVIRMLAQSPSPSASVAGGSSPTTSPGAPTGPVYSNAVTPPNAQIGVTYRYSLLTACGVRYASFAGHSWEADHPLGGPAFNPPAGWPSQNALGTVTLINSTRMVFRSAGHSDVTFHSIAGDLPLCN